jgi:DivIVA domain-containing protein
VEREQGSGAGWGAEPAHRITPEVVQSKEFGSARLRVGYVMHEVDEFLDQVTDTLAALLTENERLRSSRSTAPAAPPPADASDRAAVDAFLQREKAFLQDLGALVQTHAEQLKSMARSARAPAPSTPAADPAERPAPVGHDAPGAAAVAPASVVAPEVTPEPPGDVEAPVGSEPAAIAAAPGPAQPEPVAPVADEEDVDAILDGSDDDTRAIAPVEADEPIRIDEPEPARSRRSDEGGESSLRELFWGEE